MQLDLLGWSDSLRDHFDRLDDPGLCPARVAVEHRSSYELITDDGPIWAELGGALRHHATSKLDLPAVGDWVAVRERARIEHVLPRRSAFVRQAAGERTEPQVVAANVDVVFVVTSANADFNPRRIERYVAAIWDSGASPVLVLNKIDLCDDPDALIDELGIAVAGIPVARISALAHTGEDELRDHIPDRATVALVGSSGVGKSTIANWLIGADVLDTGGIREDDAKGRHTTTRRELHRLPGGGALIDTPGMRELQLWIDDDDLADAFGDVDDAAARCRFRDCEHEAEPGCAVREDVDPDRLASWRKLQREIAYQTDRRAVAAASKERGKAISKMMRQRKRTPAGQKLR